MNFYYNLKSWFVLFLCLATLPVFAQQTTQAKTSRGHLGLIGKSDGHSITLRWAPNGPAFWLLMRDYKYVVERAVLGQDSLISKNPEYIRLTENGIGPKPLEFWEKLSQDEPVFGPVGAQTLWGKDFTAKVQGGQSLQNRAVEESNRFAFGMFCAENSAAVADAMGLRWEDKYAVYPNRIYMYRVFTTIPQSLFPTDTGYFIVRVANIYKIPNAPEPAGVSQDGAIQVEWSKTLGFSAFWVEKSTDGINFQRATTLPIMPLQQNLTIGPGQTLQTWQDSVPNYQPFWYRVVGVTPFAEKSTPSKPVKIIAQDKTPPTPPHFVELKHVRDSMIHFIWRKDTIEQDFAGFLIERAPDYKGPWIRINKNVLSPSYHEFDDPQADFYGQNFYRIGAIDTSGNVQYSVPGYAVVVDTIPPGVPSGLTGKIDSKGVVTLSWNPNTEKDMLGYRVFFANDQTHRFVNRTGTPFSGTTFNDTVTLKTLTPKVYYQICAVDRHFNHSERTLIISIKRPDTIAPIRPVFSSVEVSDSVVYLQWIPSNSEDVVKQLVYKRPENGAWIKITELPPLVDVFQDRAKEKNHFFEYAVEAVDDSGNHSPPSMPVLVRPYDSGHKPPIKKFEAVFNEKAGHVEILWETQEGSANDYVVVFRSLNGGNLSSIRSVEASKKHYNDPIWSKKGTYHYALKWMDKSGRESPFTQTIAVEVK